MAQRNSRMETVVTEEEESDNTEENMPESKPNVDVRLIRLPRVNLLGGVKERGIKAQKKQTNLNDIWATQPNYDGRIITCRSPDGRDNTLAPEKETEETEAAIQLASTLSPSTPCWDPEGVTAEKKVKSGDMEQRKKWTDPFAHFLKAGRMGIGVRITDGNRRRDTTGRESGDNRRYRQRARLDGGGGADHRQEYGGVR